MSDHTLYSSASAMSRAFGCWRQPTGDFHVKLPSYVKVPCGYRLIRRGNTTVDHASRWHLTCLGVT